MRTLLWIVVLAALCGVAYSLWGLRRRWLERQRVADARLATFIAQAKPAAPTAPAPVPATPTVDPSVPQQRLLLEAATKAGEAGEPALSIQLYARLLARYPGSAFAAQARAAVELLKSKLAKP